MSWEPATDEDDGEVEGEEAVKRLLLHILQQHHPLILFLPHLRVVMVIFVIFLIAITTWLRWKRTTRPSSESSLTKPISWLKYSTTTPDSPFSVSPAKGFVRSSGIPVLKKRCLRKMFKRIVS